MSRPRSHRARAFSTSLALTFLLTSPVSAEETKRVIFVADDRPSSWEEGFYRQNPQPKDQFVREVDGMSLADAWNKLANGDHLIILTHGKRGGGGIQLGGNWRDGFKADGSNGTGTGGGCGDAYPLTKSNLNDVTVEVLSCWANTDPDGPAGPKKTVVQTVQDLLNGTGTNVTGHDGEVYARFSVVYKGTDQQKINAKICLRAAAEAAGVTGTNGPDIRDEWFRSMRYPDQQNTVNAAIQACIAAGKDVVGANFVYRGTSPFQGPIPNGPSRPASVGDDEDPLDEEFEEPPCDECSGTTGYPGIDALPGVVSLQPSRPNPFSQTARIVYTLPSAMPVRLSVYNVTGRLIARLVEGVQPQGKHSVTWDAQSLSSGTYFYRLEAGGQVITGRAAVVK